MNNKIKALVIIIIVILLFVVAFFAGGDNSKSNKSNTDSADIIANLQNESQSVTEEEMGEFAEQINVTKFDELYNLEGGNTLVLVARPTCSYCQLVEPIIKKLIKDYNLSINYLNTDDFSDEDNAKFITYYDEWSSGYGTPMFLLVGDGKIIDIINGATDTKHFKEFLIGHKFIEE